MARARRCPGIRKGAVPANHRARPRPGGRPPAADALLPLRELGTDRPRHVRLHEQSPQARICMETPAANFGLPWRVRRRRAAERVLVRLRHDRASPVPQCRGPASLRAGAGTGDGASAPARAAPTRTEPRSRCDWTCLAVCEGQPPALTPGAKALLEEFQQHARGARLEPDHPEHGGQDPADSAGLGRCGSSLPRGRHPDARRPAQHRHPPGASVPNPKKGPQRARGSAGGAGSLARR